MQPICHPIWSVATSQYYSNSTAASYILFARGNKVFAFYIFSRREIAGFGYQFFFFFLQFAETLYQAWTGQRRKEHRWMTS